MYEGFSGIEDYGRRPLAVPISGDEEYGLGSGEWRKKRLARIVNRLNKLWTKGKTSKARRRAKKLERIMHKVQSKDPEWEPGLELQAWIEYGKGDNDDPQERYEELVSGPEEEAEAGADTFMSRVRRASMSPVAALPEMSSEFQPGGMMLRRRRFPGPRKPRKPWVRGGRQQGPAVGPLGARGAAGGASGGRFPRLRRQRFGDIREEFGDIREEFGLLGDGFESMVADAMDELDYYGVDDTEEVLKEKGDVRYRPWSRTIEKRIASLQDRYDRAVSQGRKERADDLKKKIRALEHRAWEMSLEPEVGMRAYEAARPTAKVNVFDHRTALNQVTDPE